MDATVLLGLDECRWAFERNLAKKAYECVFALEQKAVLPSILILQKYNASGEEVMHSIKFFSLCDWENLGLKKFPIIKYFEIIWESLKNGIYVM